MNLSPLADSGMVIFWLAFGFPVTTVVFISSVFLEAMIMWSQGWDSLRRSLLDSFIMNLVSLIAAIIVGATILSEPLDELIKGELSADVSNILFAFILAWLASIVLETGTLSLLRHKSAAKTWLIALTANVSSYLIVIIFYIVLRWLYLGSFY